MRVSCARRRQRYVVVVTGGVSAIVVEPEVSEPMVPSTPVEGCGGASPVAPADGVSVRVWGALPMSGGAFW